MIRFRDIRKKERTLPLLGGDKVDENKVGKELVAHAERRTLAAGIRSATPSCRMSRTKYVRCTPSARAARLRLPP